MSEAPEIGFVYAKWLTMMGVIVNTLSRDAKYFWAKNTAREQLMRRSRSYYLGSDSTEFQAACKRLPDKSQQEGRAGDQEREQDRSKDRWQAEPHGQNLYNL